MPAASFALSKLTVIVQIKLLLSVFYGAAPVQF
jgi:hypothetical protein